MVRGQPAGAFFRLLVAVARRAGYDLDTEACTVTKGGKLVVRAPNSIERAAQEICGTMAEGKELKEGAAQVMGAVTALLCDLGPKPRVNDEEYRAAVALHTSCEGERVGEECPLCGKVVRPGHHRWCQGLQAEPGLEHDMVRDAIVGWLAGAVAVRVRRERKLEPGVRADIEAAAPVGGQVEVEIKTLDMRCESHDGQTLVKAAEEVGREVDVHYGARAINKLILDAAGNMTRDGRNLLHRLSAMGEREGDARASLLVEVGKACARAEASSMAAYREECESWDAARRLVAQDAASWREDHGVGGVAEQSRGGGDGAEPFPGGDSAPRAVEPPSDTRAARGVGIEAAVIAAPAQQQETAAVRVEAVRGQARGAVGMALAATASEGNVVGDERRAASVKGGEVSQASSEMWRSEVEARIRSKAVGQEGGWEPARRARRPRGQVRPANRG
jgi:hypothetical protein